MDRFHSDCNINVKSALEMTKGLGMILADLFSVLEQSSSEEPNDAGEAG